MIKKYEVVLDLEEEYSKEQEGFIETQILLGLNNKKENVLLVKEIK